MRFSKISITSRGVELTRQIKSPSGDIEDRHLNSPAEPLSSFVDALQAFRPFVAELLDLPLTWSTEKKDDGSLVELLTITTLNLSEDKNGLRGLIVTATKPIVKAYGKPLVMNTPLVREGTELALSDAFVLSDHVLRLIKLAEDEATRFVDGERAQAKPAEKTKPSENSKEFNERAAHAEVQSTRKPETAKKGAGKGKGKEQAGSEKDNSVQFPEKAAPSPDQVRQLLLSVDREIEVDTVAEWTAEERAQAVEWAEARQKEIIGQLADLKVPREPECVVRSATMPLKADEWTAPTPPPKAAEVEPVAQV